MGSTNVQLHSQKTKFISLSRSLPNLLLASFAKFGYGGPRKAKAFWGKGVNCAKHKRHVAPNLLLRSVAKFGVSCHRFEPYTYLHKNKKDTEWYPFYFGGNNRARTCDPLLVRQMLSQLSYAPVSDIDYITSCGECQEFILEKSSFILSISLFKYK